MDRSYLFWTLKNLKNHPVGEINCLVFAVGNPYYSLCNIKLFINVSKQGKQALSHKLVFLRGSYQDGYNYRMTIMDKDGKFKPLPVFNPRVKNCHFLEKKYFTEGSVTLRCQLTFRKEPFEHTTYVRSLSTRIGTLRNMKEFSDLVLCAGGEEFCVNRFLLQQRCPKLLEHLEINDQVRVKVNISRPVLKALLRYVYTGKFRNLPLEYDQEFHELSEICEFAEFTKEILYVKTQATLCTEISVFRKKVYWDMVSVENAVSGKIPSFKPVQLGSTRLLLNASVKQLGRGAFIKINVHCTSALNEPILLNCIMSIAVDNNNLESHPEIRLQFSPEDKEIAKPLKYVCNKKLQKDSGLQIVLNISLSTGENTCSVEDVDQSRSPMCSDLQSAFGMGLLSLDLKELYEKTMHGDIQLLFWSYRSESSGALRAHRAILAASSPVFKSMLIEAQNSDPVIKTGVDLYLNPIIYPGVAQNIDSLKFNLDVHCGKRLLEYLYSGEVYTCGYESDLEFFGALTKYQVSSSDNKFTKLFVSHLELAVRLLKQRGARKQLAF